jgi:hypothetical protein
MVFLLGVGGKKKCRFTYLGDRVQISTIKDVFPPVVGLYQSGIKDIGAIQSFLIAVQRIFRAENYGYQYKANSLEMAAYG